MKFRTHVEPPEPMRGLEVPPEVVQALGAGKRPVVAIIINGHSWRSRIAIMRGRHLIGPGSHRDPERKNCSRCTAGCCAPATGSAPASAASVLFRSRGASKPARYFRNPRRYANRTNRSSNRAAYSSKCRNRQRGRRALARRTSHPEAGGTPCSSVPFATALRVGGHW
jgi:Domain of unknown function (DUF1905)